MPGRTQLLNAYICTTPTAGLQNMKLTVKATATTAKHHIAGENDDILIHIRRDAAGFIERAISK